MADTLIEIVRVIDGSAPLWPLHRWRLMNSALMLGLPMPEIDAPADGPDRVVRIEFGADGVVVSDADGEGEEGLSLATAPAEHRGYPYKIGNRAWLEAARATARIARADDALLFDVDGHLVEATRWAIGWWEGEMLCFPPLSLGGLRSVGRARLTEMARSGVKEAMLRREELAKVSLVACNAVRGIVPVTLLDGRLVPDNPRTAGIARRFWDRPAA